MKLTDVERMILLNQHLILAQLDSSDIDHHRNSAEILQSGYEGLYDRVFEYLSPPTSKAISDEVFQIFDMYRALDAAYRNGISNPKGPRPKFNGFDGNNDDHFGVASFILDKLGLYAEQRNQPRNSHSQADLAIYRRMLTKWNSLGRPHPPTAQQVSDIVNV